MVILKELVGLETLTSFCNSFIPHFLIKLGQGVKTPKPPSHPRNHPHFLSLYIRQRHNNKNFRVKKKIKEIAIQDRWHWLDQDTWSDWVRLSFIPLFFGFVFWTSTEWDEFDWTVAKNWVVWPERPRALSKAWWLSGCWSKSHQFRWFFFSVD